MWSSSLLSLCSHHHHPHLPASLQASISHPEYRVYHYLLSFHRTKKKRKKNLSVFFKEAAGIHSPSGTVQQSSSTSLCYLGLGLSVQHKARMALTRLSLLLLFFPLSRLKNKLFQDSSCDICRKQHLIILFVWSVEISLGFCLQAFLILSGKGVRFSGAQSIPSPAVPLSTSLADLSTCCLSDSTKCQEHRCEPGSVSYSPNSVTERLTLGTLRLVLTPLLM